MQKRWQMRKRWIVFGEREQKRCGIRQGGIPYRQLLQEGREEISVSGRRMTGSGREKKSMFEKVAGILRECMEKDVAEITEDMDLVADLGLSSLDVMDAALAFEEEFGVEIPDDRIMEFKTVGDIVEYLER